MKNSHNIQETYINNWFSKNTQDLISAVDPNFFPNFNFAWEIVAQDSRLQQEPSFPLNPNLGLINRHRKFKQAAESNAPSALKDVQATNVSDPDRFPSDFVQDPYAQVPKLPLPKSSQDPMSPVDSTPTFVPNLEFAQNTFTQDSTLQLWDKKAEGRNWAKGQRDFWEGWKDQAEYLGASRPGHENVHLVKQFRGYLEKLRTEKSALEQANHSLARENLEAKENQGEAKKDKELIRKLNCELGRSGRIRKKQSALVKANESLAKDHSELRGGSDKH